MKTAVNTAKVLVGVLFIVSGLVKANDPLGLSYKMQEFFEVWNTDLGASSFFLKTPLTSLFTFLNAHTLSLSVGMIILEIMAGVGLLLGWRKNGILLLLGLLILFFTFLTGYAYASGKFKNCGCFGDCLPISPLVSFIKDLALVLLIAFLIACRKYITTIRSRSYQRTTLGAALLFSLGLQWYVLQYLPLADCLPFKKKASIAEGLKLPPNAIPDSFAIRFVYEKGGKKFEFNPENLPGDLGSYTFIDRRDKLIRKGNAEPAIKGFALTGFSDVDSTAHVLDEPYAILFFYENDNDFYPTVLASLEAVYKQAFAKQVPVYLITTSINTLYPAIEKKAWPGLQVFKVDFTAFRTAARTNPSIYLLQKGTILDKRSALQAGKINERINRIR